MDVQEAYEKVESEHMKELDGTYLCSALAFVDEQTKSPSQWELNYYDKKTEKITQISVTFSSATLQTIGEPTRGGDIEWIDISQVKLSVQDALEIAKTIQKAKYMQPVQGIFVSLQMDNKHLVWSVSIISKLLSIITIKIDAVTGNVLDTTVKSFLQGTGKAE